MKTKMNKQMFFGFVIFSLAAMMFTSQMPLAFANDVLCVNETLSGNIQNNIRIPNDSGGDGPDGIPGNQDDGLNVCVFDNLVHKGNLFIEENASLHVTGGSSHQGDIKLEGKYAAINFEETFEMAAGPDGILETNDDVFILDENGKPKLIPNTKDGNIQLLHEDSYAFIANLILDGNINGKGELYISSNFDRFTADADTNTSVFIDGNVLLDGNGDNELRVDGGEITGNLRVFKNHSYLINDAIIGGNLDIKDAFLSSDFEGIPAIVEDSFYLIENNDIAGNFNFQDNNLSEATINGNDVGGNAICKNNDGTISGDSSTNWVGGKAKNDCKNLFDKPTPNFP